MFFSWEKLSVDSYSVLLVSSKETRPLSVIVVVIGLVIILLLGFVLITILQKLKEVLIISKIHDLVITHLRLTNWRFPVGYILLLLNNVVLVVYNRRSIDVLELMVLNHLRLSELRNHIRWWNSSWEHISILVI